MATAAEHHFRDAATAMARCDQRAMRPARLMGATYAALLACLRRRGWRDPGARIALPARRKLWIALRYGLF
jgi:phytoene synthase